MPFRMFGDDSKKFKTHEAAAAEARARGDNGYVWFGSQEKRCKYILLEESPAPGAETNLNEGDDMDHLIEQFAKLERMVEALHGASLLKKAALASDLTKVSMALTRASFETMKEFETRLRAAETELQRLCRTRTR